MGMRLVPVLADIFYMGSAREGKGADEASVHKVALSKGSLMPATEVTNAPYDAFDPDYKRLRSKTKTPDKLIHLVSSSIHYQFNLAWLTVK